MIALSSTNPFSRFVSAILLFIALPCFASAQGLSSELAITKYAMLGSELVGEMDEAFGEAGPETETEETATFTIEAHDVSFELGKETGFEGMRMAHVGSSQTVLLIEDNLDPVVYLRFGRFQIERVEIAVYDEQGNRVFGLRKANLSVGEEISFMYDTWAAGTYTLQVRTSNGEKWKKQIVKS
ncbi:MAG: hypothetical protein AAGM67_12375 [Bacteroidota bacterium]